MHHRHTVAVAALFGGLAMGAAACGSGSSSDAGSLGTASPGSSISPASSASTASSTASTAAAAGATAASSPAGAAVKVASTSLGPVVVDAEGRTLYLFTPDTGLTSTCSGGCASAWPPAAGPVTAGDGVTGALGVTTRADGTQQATLAGHPLYRYAGDAAPGDVTGQGLNGKWYVVDGSGKAVTSSPSGAASGY